MSNLKNLLGNKYNMLTVIEYAGLTKEGKAQWKCLCDCGNTNIVSAANLKKKGRSTQSCGCLLYLSKGPGIRLPGLGCKDKIYKAYQGIKMRCYNTKYAQYKDYGGRGILMAPEYLDSYHRFYEDMYPCPEPKKDYSVGRKNNDIGYIPGNLSWETRTEQQNNTRFNRILEYKGRKQTITQWSNELGLNRTYISHRLARGWSVERAIEYPIIKRK